MTLRGSGKLNPIFLASSPGKRGGDSTWDGEARGSFQHYLPGQVGAHGSPMCLLTWNKVLNNGKVSFWDYSKSHSVHSLTNQNILDSSLVCGKLSSNNYLSCPKLFSSKHFSKALAMMSCYQFSSVQFSSVTQSSPTLCDPMNRSTPGLPVHHQLLEFTQTHVHRVSDAIQPSHPLSSPSPPAPSCYSDK